MLYQNATDIVQTQEAPLLPGEIIHEEGVALVWTRLDGKSYLKLSTGAAGEVFAGFALARSMPPATQVRVEEFTIDATLKFTVGRLPIAGQILVKIDGEKADQTAGTTAPAAGEVAVSGADFYFHADDKDKKVFIQFAYELSAIEARSYTADAPVGGLATNIEGSVGYIKLGNVSTNLFDASADWADDTKMHPSLGAGGTLTLGGTGTVLKGCIIKQTPQPGAMNGFLVIEMTSSYGA